MEPRGGRGLVHPPDRPATADVPPSVYLSGKLVYHPLFMEIAFRARKIKRLCERGAEARRRLGQASAKKLGARLSDLEAAASVAELVAGRPHPLVGDRLGQFAVDLSGADAWCSARITNRRPATRTGRSNGIR